jgi:hypothetical protein
MWRRDKRVQSLPHPIGYLHIDIAEVRTEEGKMAKPIGLTRNSDSTKNRS